MIFLLFISLNHVTASYISMLLCVSVAHTSFCEMLLPCKVGFTQFFLTAAHHHVNSGKVAFPFIVFPLKNMPPE